MMHMTIKVQSKAEAEQGDKMFPEFDETNTKMADALTVGILEGGMTSGATSLVFALKVGDELVMVETSGKLFEGLYSAYKGAQERFGQPLIR